MYSVSIKSCANKQLLTALLCYQQPYHYLNANNNPKMPKKSGKTLPNYEEESEKLPAERFVTLVERQAEVQGWDDKETADNAIEANTNNPCLDYLIVCQFLKSLLSN